MVKSFSLGGTKWNVIFNDDRMNDLNLLGLCEFPKATITLNNDGINGDVIDSTFYHELVHAILDSMDRKDLSGNEIFVQGFATLLHQFEVTKEII